MRSGDARVCANEESGEECLYYSSSQRRGLRLHAVISERGAAAVYRVQRLLLCASIVAAAGERNGGSDDLDPQSGLLLDIDEATSNGSTGLMKAAHTGQTMVVKLLLEAGAAVNRRDNTNGVSALILAASSGHVAVAELLLRHGADPTLSDRSGRSPLLYAARRGHADVVEVLLLGHTLPSSSARTSRTIPPPPPSPPPSEKSAALVMICQGDEMGLAPLAGAAQNGHARVVELLLLHILRLSAVGSGVGSGGGGGGGDDNERCSGSTGHLSTATAPTVAASAMIIDRQDETGCSALHSACFRGHAEVIAILLAAGADASRRDSDSEGGGGVNAAQWALEGGHEGVAAEVVRLQLQHAQFAGQKAAAAV